MALRPLREVAPQYVDKIEHAARDRVAALKRDWPIMAVSTANNALAAAAAGAAADQISKRLMAKGTVPAVLAGLAGAAAARTLVDGGFKVGVNLWQKKAWDDHLLPTMVEGARRGAINGGLVMLYKPITKAMQNRYGELGPIKLAAATGAVRGTVGGAANSIANPKTWEKGFGRGVAKVAVTTVRSGVQGAASAAVSAKVSPWVHGKLDRYIDFTALGQGGFFAKGGGGGSGDGWLFKLFEHHGGGGVGGGVAPP
jgi:hypothetical protein